MAIDILRAYRTEPPPRDFVLPGLIPGTVGSIVSPGGAGKSMLALILAHEVASGVNLVDLGCAKQGRTVYLSAEDGTDVIEERLHYIGMKLSEVHRGICAENMVIEDLAQNAPDLFNDKWLTAIEALASGTRLMFLDTLRSFHNEDENDGGRMNMLISQLRAIAARTKCAIVFLHHSSKSMAVAGQGDMQQASRGSSVLTDNIRWQAYLSGMTKDEATKLSATEDRAPINGDRGYFVRFGISKQNYGAPLNEIWFRRNQFGMLEPIQLYDAKKAAGKEEGNRRRDEF